MRFRRLLLGASLAISLAASPTAKAVGEYDLKVAFVLNIAGFVDWPAPVAGGSAELVACVPAGSLLRAPLESLAGQRVAGRVLRVSVAPTGEEGADCHILVLPASAAPRPTVAARRALTFAESTDLRPSPHAVTFAIVDQRLRFRVNLQALKHAGLSVSSKVLRLAQAVDGS